MSLDLLRTFLAVHRAGSITGGAQSLGLSQPTVTAQLKTLERNLGRPLFDRLPRGVRPTSAGNELARRIAEPVDVLQSLLSNELDDPAPTTLHLGGPSDFLCHEVLPALAPRIASGLQVRTTFGLPDDLLDRLQDRSLDLVISSTRPRRAGLRATPCYDETFTLVAAPHWAPASPVTTPDQLRAIPLIAYAEEAPILRRYWRTVFNTRLTRTPDLVVPDLRGALTTTLAGAGLTVLPTYLCHPHLTNGTLVPLTTPEVPPLNTLYLTTRIDSAAATTAVQEHLLAVLRAS
ncbi:LysR family transcriptional regulator [Kribbella sp. NPDC056951]|uniref:LysR family transcriptional regulator n=1 Tax=Kribbella sp. NPDC056951 TaxID=3345978 RepID=UPI0036267DB8